MTSHPHSPSEPRASEPRTVEASAPREPQSDAAKPRLGAPGPPAGGPPSKHPELKYTNRLTLLGLLLSAVLQYVHAKTYLAPSSDSFCTVGQTLDCAAVAASKYSVVLGLPWATWGIIAFGVMLFASLQRSFWLLPLSAVSAAVSVLLFGVSWFGVGSLCLLCEGVHLVSCLLFLLVWRGRDQLVGPPWSLNAGGSLLLPSAGLALGLVFFLPEYWQTIGYRGDPSFATGVTESGDPWIGAKEPGTVIEEFVDYRCPHCKAVSQFTLAQLANHPDWRIVRRHQPRMRCVASVEASCTGLRAAQCAAEQTNFWRADRWLFIHQDVRRPPDLQQMAADLDIDEAKLTSCYASDVAFQRAHHNYQRSVRERVRYVPAHKVDGKKVQLNEYLKLGN